MEVILLERVGRLGSVGDVVNVKSGFGRNFLLPQKKALRATEENRAEFEKRRSEIEAKNAAARAEAEKQIASLEGITLSIARQASEDGKLYGSITVRDIAEELLAQGRKDVERRHIELNNPIRTLGNFPAKIRLHPEVAASITVSVVRNADGRAEINTATDETDAA